MSEQTPQNQNLLNEQEMRARDDAIFNTVADFRNELDSPPEQQPEVPEYKGIGADDAEKQVDVDAIFDNRKAETTGVGSGRRRKAYDEKLDKQRFNEEMETKRDLLEEGVQIKPIEGFGRHRAGQDAFELTLAAKHDGPAPGQDGKKSAHETPAELTEHGEIDEGALARAEAAVRDMDAMPFRGAPAASSPETPDHEAGAADTSDNASVAPAPIPAPAPAAPTGNKHRRPRRGRTDPVTVAQQTYPAQTGVPRPPRMPSVSELGSGLHTPSTEGEPGKSTLTPRIMADGEVGAGDTQTKLVVGGAPESHAAAPDVVPDNEGEPITVTPEARLRDRIIGRLGKLVNREQVSGELRAARDEIRDAWYQFRPRREPTTSGERDSFMTRHGDKITVAAAGIGLAAVAAGLGIQHNNTSYEGTVPRASASATPGENNYGPQVPKTSESPSPSASASATETPSASPSSSSSSKEATPTTSPTTKAPVTGPSAIPSTPDFSTKPHAPEAEPPASSGNQEQTKHTAYEDISFTTKDGTVVKATATLKPGGNIIDAGHQIDLTDTQILNAVNEAGITSQQASNLRPGQQVEFDQAADGSYVVHLR
jgi:hypothetical protein